ncbi:undecaprenyl diphosphate synthase family protein [Aeropyrum camini]|uniref:Tritrans,polycis-undecaprenyl-diphosphate synthase (geranylgeranyl-diphosphate specific) n=1 Tax=Aeropyrum camini SY1 = JCM 12091 TaxID=1198449 RepID=U3TEF4_9CREN|nr:undecaprenyl diphosphate synthase family protein [Aeropyrum camini]BAN90343.1 UDP pyrophosphate synthetase [Aeropyrum camini SY1 = JCM 12091]
MKLPKAIGIIPDGNRRWARLRGENLYIAYYTGYRNVKRILGYIRDFYPSVRSVYLYVLSRDNCSKRSRGELSILYRIMRRSIEKDIEEIKMSGASLVIVGDLNHPNLPENIREGLAPYHFDFYMKNGGLPEGRRVVAGLCYDPFWEIEHYSPKLLPSRLLDEIDLVIRTGGEKRLSSFFPLLTRYAELYFTDKLWPDFTREDLDEAVKWFSTRRRPMGR